MHLVFQHDDGSATAVQVNDLSTVQVKTWTPAVFGDGATMPQLVEDQTVSLNGVTAVHFDDAPPAGATVLATTDTPLEPLTDEQAAALDAQFETAPPVTAKPWEDN